jgi:hypothetical protein
MDATLEIAIQALLKSLTAVWEDNGNIMADAVRDSVILDLSQISGMSIQQIEEKVNILIEDAQ